MDTLQQVRLVWKPLVFLLCLLPLALTVTDVAGLTAGLGANPVEELLDRFGNWGLRFIMLTLAITPLRRITGWTWLPRFRRMFGLFTFFYVALHFTTYVWLDQGLMMSVLVEDVIKRPFITIGFVAFLLLLAMAATSTNGMRRRMRRRWDQLHYSAYAVGVLGVWHYWWQVKKDISEPLIYAGVLAILLGARVIWWRKRRAANSR